jgi:hypothetical protein
MTCKGKSLRFTFLSVSSIERRMKKTELKWIDLIWFDETARNPSRSAWFCLTFICSNAQTHQDLRAETNHGTLRVQKRWPLHRDIRDNQRQRGRRNFKSAALITLHDILVLQLSLHLVQGYLKVNQRSLHIATRSIAKSLSTQIICYAHDNEYLV